MDPVDTRPVVKSRSIPPRPSRSAQPKKATTERKPKKETKRRSHAETASSSDSDDGSGDGLAIAALIVGALGLLAGGTALVTSSRSKQ